MFGLDAFHPGEDPVRVYGILSHHLSGDYHWPRQLSGGARRVMVKTKNPTRRSLYHFWSKIFAVNFGMGVVSGLVMAYQFGTNWSGFSEFAGSITGPLLTYEVLTAFFLEAGFLGVMLFGWNRVGRASLLRDLYGCAGYYYFYLLDPRLQQLDANATGL